MINLKIRAKNVSFWISIIIAFLTPILAYMGISREQITTWPQFADIMINAIKNPYVVMLIIASVYNAVIDPTTKGIKDSPNVMNTKVLTEGKDD